MELEASRQEAVESGRTSEVSEGEIRIKGGSLSLAASMVGWSATATAAVLVGVKAAGVQEPYLEASCRDLRNECEEECVVGDGFELLVIAICTSVVGIVCSAYARSSGYRSTVDRSVLFCVYRVGAGCSLLTAMLVYAIYLLALIT